MKKLTVDREFFAYLPRHSEEEHARLEAQLIAEGVLDPIRIWKGKDVIVDGMERWSIIQQHKLKFETVELEFADRESVKAWISRNQIIRRNLTKQQLDYHLGVLYNSQKQPHGGDRTSDEAEEPTGDTAQTIADSAGPGVGKQRVKKAGGFAALVDAASEMAPEVRKAINDGVKIGKAELKAIAEAETKAEAKKLADIAINGEPEEPEEIPAPQVPAPKKVVKDGGGKVITDHRYWGVFLDIAEFNDCLKKMRALEAQIKRLIGSAGGGMMDIADFGAFKGMKAALVDRRPRGICVTCKGEHTIEDKGKRLECPSCGGLGWLDEFKYGRLTAKK